MAFQDKTVLITGASSGLGASLAKALSQEGARLVLVARNMDNLRLVGAECTHSPLLIAADISQKADCERVISETIRTFNKIDFLILNAAVSMWAPFEAVQDVEVFRKLIETNYLGPVYLTHFALSSLKASEGKVVVISSIQGHLPVPFHSGYVASKHALNGFFETLQSEGGLDVLIVSPTWIQGTGLKNRPLVQHGSRSQKHRGLTLDFCTKKILQAMQKKQQVLFLPRFYRCLVWLHSLFPTWIRYFVAKAVKK